MSDNIYYDLLISLNAERLVLQDKTIDSDVKRTLLHLDVHFNVTVT